MDSQGKSKVALTFAVYQKGDLVRRETVAQDIVKVGKDPRSHLRIDDDLASRMHAVIEVASENEITLIDLGNEPGTNVNGQRVNKCRIRPGDQIQIGSTVLAFEHAESPASVNPGFVEPPRAHSATSAAAVAASAQTSPPSATRSAGRSGEATTSVTRAARLPNPFALGDPFSASGVAAGDPMQGLGVGLHRARGEIGIGPAAPTFSRVVDDSYLMIKSAPAVSLDDVEVHLPSVEVVVSWGTNVLHVTHLTPPRSFYLGEEFGEKTACDYLVPRELLGAARAALVLVRGSSAYLQILPGTSGEIDLPGEGRIALAALIAGGRVESSTELAGAYLFELRQGVHARIELAGSALVFEVSAVNAGKPVPVGIWSTFEPAAYLFAGLSFLLHMGIVASLAFFMPTMRGDDSESIDRDQMLMMQHLLNAAAERELEQREAEQVADNADNKEGGTGTRAKGEEGSMGNPNTKDTGKKFAIQGPQDNVDPHVARQAALREAAEFGMIGLLNVGGGGDPNAPVAPWGREDSLGNDPLSARGNMWGDAIGDAFGAGGFGLSGVGEGGGGRGEGIGLGNIGTIGHGSGRGSGQGFGSGHGRLGGAHQSRGPTIRQGATQVNGRLPPEVIQRIVRQNFGRFRLCYEGGLRTNPNLQGRVAVKFVIDRSGSVATASDGGSELADKSVVQCVVRGFSNLSFPQPEGGIVTVTYPITFSPGD